MPSTVHGPGSHCIEHNDRKQETWVSVLILPFTGCVCCVFCERILTPSKGPAPNVTAGTEDGGRFLVYSQASPRRRHLAGGRRKVITSSEWLMPRAYKELGLKLLRTAALRLYQGRWRPAASPCHPLR